MVITKIKSFFYSIFKEKSIPFVRENSKLIAQFFLTALFFGLGIWFLKHERAELAEVKTTLLTSQWQWVVLGILITGIYITLQGLMYVASFSSIQCKVKLRDTIGLFLKRNLISVFLPAGGVSSLAFFTGPLEKKRNFPHPDPLCLHTLCFYRHSVGSSGRHTCFYFTASERKFQFKRMAGTGCPAFGHRIVALSVQTASIKKALLPVCSQSFPVT